MEFPPAYPGRPCTVPGFDPREDVLVIALPDHLLDAAQPRISLHHDRAAGRLELSLATLPGTAPLVIHLPGLAELPGDAVALVSLSDGAALGLLPGGIARPADPPPPPRPAAPPPGATIAALTGEGLYPADEAGRNGPARGPIRRTVTHDHDWERDGPPPERFYDLSHPASQFSIALPPAARGPVHAIRFIEETGSNGTSDMHSSIVLVQGPPGSAPLSPGDLAAKFSLGTGTPDFRAIAWIWLGNAGHFTDPATGRRRPFGRINDSPDLRITGPIAGSVEIRRGIGTPNRGATP